MLQCIALHSIILHWFKSQVTLLHRTQHFFSSTVTHQKSLRCQNTVFFGQTYHPKRKSLHLFCSTQGSNKRAVGLASYNILLSLDSLQLYITCLQVVSEKLTWQTTNADGQEIICSDMENVQTFTPAGLFISRFYLKVRELCQFQNRDKTAKFWCKYKVYNIYIFTSSLFDNYKLDQETWLVPDPIG